MKIVEMRECLHADVDGIRIEVPLPKERKERLVVQAAIRKVKWCDLSEKKDRCYWHVF